MITRLTGVDPGLVDNGIVSLRIDDHEKSLAVATYVLSKTEVVSALETMRLSGGYEHTWIESYRERGKSYSTSVEMRELLREMKHALPKAKVLDNTGVKKVVKPKLMELLGLTGFRSTHHQDLQSAARILVYGALKDPELNKLLYGVVIDQIDHGRWKLI